MTEKAIFIDTSKCIGCRACQVACKQWWGLPAELPAENEAGSVQFQYKFSGSYQNPGDLSHQTWNLVRFKEEAGPDGKMKWFFTPDRCRHCKNPPCQEGCPVPGVIVKDESGGVYYNVEKCGDCAKQCAEYCPFGIPKFDGDVRRAFKCRFCIDRVQEGKIPACAKTCPPGAIQFGDKTEMVSRAQARLAVIRADNPEANIYPGTDYNNFWLLLYAPEKYSLAQADFTRTERARLAAARTSRKPFTVAGFFKPLTYLGMLGGLGLAFFRRADSGKNPEGKTDRHGK